MKSRTIIGIDEAGRGPLAGPVSVGVFAVKSREVLKKFRGVKDSKQLSEAQREEWFGRIKITAPKKQSQKKWQIAYAVSFSSAKTIDEKGISFAIKSALNRALKKLERKGIISSSAKVLLDGSLKAPIRYKDQKTIIDGDAKEPVIALASICAKVLRDRRMKKLAKIYPRHGFEIHKGYGTKGHYIAIKKYGVTVVHRKSFLKSLSGRNVKK